MDVVEFVAVDLLTFIIVAVKMNQSKCHVGELNCLQTAGCQYIVYDECFSASVVLNTFIEM